MSRSGYHEDSTEWSYICWRGAVTSAIRGERGQAFLIGLGQLMDEMPEKKLIKDSFVNDCGMCTLGVAANALNIQTDDLIIKYDYFSDDESEVDNKKLAERLNIAEAMAREIQYMNDEHGSWLGEETPEKRWRRMREWVRENIIT